VCDLRVFLSDEEGNINPYATFPLSRPAESPPSWGTAAERRPLTRDDDTNVISDDRRSARLKTVRVSVHLISRLVCVAYTCRTNGLQRGSVVRTLAFAGGLSLIYADLWLTCDHFVGNVSAMGQPTRPTQPSISLGSAIE